MHHRGKSRAYTYTCRTAFHACDRHGVPVTGWHGGVSPFIISGKFMVGKYLGGNPKIGGKNPKWMVKIMENPIKMDDFGITTIFGNIQIV